MKNLLICLAIIVILFGGVGGYFLFKNITESARIEEIKKGWYIEIKEEYINVREDSNTSAKILGKALKGTVYKVIDMNFDNGAYYWYKIEYDGNEAWIASKKSNPYVNDYNNPKDIAVPVIKYHEDIYKVVNMDEINYKHLEIIEDRADYEINHIVYHEYKPSEHKDQYWILYTITDAAGKSSSKLQKIEFEERPKKEEVVDFSEYEKK